MPGPNGEAMPKIYVYRQGDTLFADVSRPKECDVLRVYNVNSRRAADALKANPGPLLPHRVISLLERLELDLPTSGMSRPFSRSLAGS